MTTTQRPRTPRRSGPPPGPSPASRGLILVVVGVVLGLILLVKAGGAGVDTTGSDVEIGGGADVSTTTTAAPTTTAPQGKAPQTVQVVAGNGSKVSGLAGKTGQFLAQAGYTQVVATDSLQPVTASVVYFAPGCEANAQQVAQLLSLQSGQVQALPTGAKLAKNQPDTACIVVLIGPELANVVGAASGTTGTTVAGATTTVAGSSGTSKTTTTASTTTTAP